MLTSKVPKQVILSKIQVSRSAFDVSASGLVSLNASKVPDDVIKAMMLPPASAAKGEAPPAPAPPPAATAKGKPASPAKPAAKKTPPKKP